MTRRVMMVGLDGFEPSVAQRMLAAGDLPALARVIAEGAAVPLDHGPARRTGLAWEHVSTGLSPDDAERWAAVDLDAAEYRAVQQPTRLPPFPAHIPCRTVVFDPPYFDLAASPAVEGVTGWGAHDPGVAPAARPASLAGELAPYSAQQFIYGFVWPSPDRTRLMADALVRAVEERSAAAQWLFGKRLPDWELGYLVVSEYHSALEALWHGVDPDHPLHALPSAAPAKAGIEGVYRAVDRCMAGLLERFPDADFLFFNLHGMGANNADVASMALLPELLFRAAFGRGAMGLGSWEQLPDGTPLLPEGASWSGEVLRLLRPSMRARDGLRRIGARLGLAGAAGGGSPPLGWMPAAHYARFWPRMRAFALPSFYDGRVRINLAGREARGLVRLEDYGRACEEVEGILAACTEPRTGSPIVAEIVRTSGDPVARAASEPDLTILWRDCPLGAAHPRLGTIGPLPYRRTGGHTGGDGVAYCIGPNVRQGSFGLRSAFDVVPTVLDLLGVRASNPISGTSFAPIVARAA